MKLCSICGSMIRKWMIGRINGSAPKHTDLCLTCRIVFRRLGNVEEIR